MTRQYLITGGAGFIGSDNWTPVEKPVHTLAKEIGSGVMNRSRRQYDQYIANSDYELGKLFMALQENGRMDDSYIIFTSDHGELFERGTVGHSTRLIYEPILHVPLLIHAPGQKVRKDIYDLTSNVDILPTLFSIIGQPGPDGMEGQVLPGFRKNVDPDRQIFSLEAKSNSVFKPIQKASIALLLGNYKLIRYLGYPGGNGGYEFYHLSDDPEEMNDLYATHPIAPEMLAILDQKVKDINRPYR